MRNRFLIILLSISTLSFSQIGLSVNSKTFSKNDIYKQIIYTTDSVGDTFLSSEREFDKFGREVLSIDYNKQSDSIGGYYAKFYGDTVELNVYYEKDLIDTAIYKYDEYERIVYEYWYWGDEQESEDSYYFYKDSSENEFCIIDNYSWGSYCDSLFYEENLLVKKVSYDLEYGIESAEKYCYQDTLLIEKSQFDDINGLIEYKENYFYTNNLLDSMISISYTTNEKRIKKYSYYDSDALKDKVITIYKDSKLEEIEKHLYDEGGLEQTIIYLSNNYETKIQYEYIRFEE